MLAGEVQNAAPRERENQISVGRQEATVEPQGEFNLHKGLADQVGAASNLFKRGGQKGRFSIRYAYR